MAARENGSSNTAIIGIVVIVLVVIIAFLLFRRPAGDAEPDEGPDIELEVVPPEDDAGGADDTP